MPKTLEQVLPEHYKNVRSALDSLLNGIDQRIRGSIMEEVKEELRVEPPTPGERQALLDYAFDLETEMLIRAETAGRLIDSESVNLETEKSFRRFLFFFLLVTFFPLIGFLVEGAQWRISEFRLWAVMLSQAMAFMVITLDNQRFTEKWTARFEHLSKVRQTAENLASEAAFGYKVDLASVSRPVIQDRLARLSMSRDRLMESDRMTGRFDPPRNVIQEAAGAIPRRVKPMLGDRPV